MKYPNYSDAQIEKRYADAREIYDDFGINTDTVLRKLDKIRISMHCWQVTTSAVRVQRGQNADRRNSSVVSLK